MLKNYLKIAVRNLFKHKLYSFINIFGLSIGITCCLLIFLFVKHELSFNDFQQNSENIFRLVRVANDGKVIRDIGITSAPFAPALLNDYPFDIKDAVRVFPNDGLVSYGEKSFREKRFYLADHNFFEIFSFPLLSGNGSSVLKNPNDVVISESMARKYFGDKDPTGKTLMVDKSYSFKVTGIFKNIPENSHLKFDFIASIKFFEAFDSFNEWWNNSLVTYVVLSNPSVKEFLEPKLSAFMNKYFGDHFKTTGMPMELKLEPFEKIYFNNETQFDPLLHGDKNNIYIFSGIGLFILAIACINFMNLATARSAERRKEVGLRKVIGANRRNLIIQFIGESIILTSVSVLISLLLAELSLPIFNSLTELKLKFPYSLSVFPAVLISITLIVGVISGSYPAVFLSSLQPVSILKGRINKSGRSIQLRKLLVVLQFSLSILLIVSTLIIKEQMNFLSEKKLGFDKEQVLFFNLDNRELRESAEILRDELIRQPFVVSASAMTGLPGGYHDNYAYKAEGEHNFTRMRNVFTDFGYLSTLGLKLKTGRNFSKEFSTDKYSVILNEKSVKTFGWEIDEALGKRILINLLDSTYRTVIGVVEDYHFISLKQKIEPLVIAAVPDYRVIAVKIKPGNLPGYIKEIENIYSRFSPGYPFEYQFLDDSFNQLYTSEKKQEDIFSLFSFLAIFISCLGLFGLASFSAEQRIKEIGIRKVLGATVPEIFVLISTQFLKLVVVANVIAWPFAYFLMDKWLEDFEYRINIALWTFIIAGISALMIAVITVSYQAIKAATANPVKSLRYE